MKIERRTAPFKIVAMTICLFTTRHSFAATFDEVDAELRKIKAFPAQLFPATCWPGFTEKSEITTAWSFDVFRTCIANDPKAVVKKVRLVRSGQRFIADVLVELAPWVGKKCDSKVISDFLGSRAPSFDVSIEKDGTTGGASSNKLYREISVSVSCSKFPPSIDTAAMSFKTAYSDVGTTGKPITGNTVVLADTPSFEPPPYFRSREESVDSMIVDAKKKIALWKDREAKLSGLAKLLYQDNAAWAVDRKHLEAKLEFSNSQRAAKAASAADPVKMAESEAEFLRNTSCVSTCLRTAPKGPLCKAAEDEVKKFMAARPVGQKQSPEELERTFKELGALEQSSAQVACKRETIETSKSCAVKCPDALKEACESEAQTLLRYLKSLEDTKFSVGNTYVTDLERDGFFSAAKMYKFGFVKSFVNPPIKFGPTQPEHMNSDWYKKEVPDAPALLGGSQKIPFVEAVSKFCGDCTASTTAFKAAVIADPRGDGVYDVWTIDQTGLVTRLKNAFAK